MTTREKIIVGVMCLAIVYGVYEVVGVKGTKNKTAPAQTNSIDDLRKFSSEITRQMTAEKMGKEYQYMVRQAGTAWTRDPFIQSVIALKAKADIRTAATKASDKSGLTSNFVFTGFLKLGDTQLAVINGVEYKIGEALDTDGHYLKSVSAQRIVIGRLNSQETIQVPISESY